MDEARVRSAMAMRAAGATYVSIGDSLGVTAERARQICLEHEVRKRRRARGIGPKKPEWHAGLSLESVRELRRAGLLCREACLQLLQDDLSIYRGKRIVVPSHRRDATAQIFKEDTVSLRALNEVRVWLGGEPFLLPRRVVTRAELARAVKLLQENGYIVLPTIHAAY